MLVAPYNFTKQALQFFAVVEKNVRIHRKDSLQVTVSDRTHKE